MSMCKAVQEVREWRENAAKKTEGLSPEEERRIIHEVGEKYRKKLGLKTYRQDYKEVSLK